MTETIIYCAIGFLAAGLSVLFAVPLVNRRAMRLATQSVEDAALSSVAKITAERDLQRAEFAASTQRFEAMIDQLKTDGTEHLLELGRREDAINRLGAEISALRDQLRAAEEQSAAKAIALYQAQRTISAKDLELATLMRQLDERSTLTDVQKIEISALKIEVEALKEALEGSTNRSKALEERWAAERAEFAAASQKLMDDRQQAERAVIERESEFSRLSAQLTERSALADIEISAFKAEIAALRQSLDGARAELAASEFPSAAQETERALAAKESEVTEIRGQLDERSALADLQNVEISALEAQVAVLKESLSGARAELNALQDCRNAERIEFEAATQGAERALSEKEAQVSNLIWQLDEQSSLVDTQKIEIVALKVEVEALKKASEAASVELRTIQNCRAADRTELKAANEKLIEARSEFEQFQRRVAELVKQVVAQNAEDKIRAQDLEDRVIEQSRLLDQRASELSQLRGEIEIACKAEADLRSTSIEIEGRANAAIQDLKAEAAKLQAAFDRANAERMRLAHEVTKLRRQTEEIRAA